MRLLHHGPTPKNADFAAFFRVFPGKAGAPVLILCGSLLLSHTPAPVKRKTTKQSAAHLQAPRKQAGDLLVSGRAYSNYAQYGHTLAVRVAVEVPARRWRKELAVFGDRVWLPGLTGASPSAPQPFQSVPVDYAHAFGGEGYAWNPTGLGTGGGERGKRLPNVEFADRPLTSPASAPGPAGFGPIDPAWQPRASGVGTYGDDWLKNHWPGLPADFSPGYWSEAPADQQFPGGFRGDELIAVHNMHPEQPQFALTLPGLRCRLFLKKTSGVFGEVAAMLDTVSVDMAAGHTELIWRGAVAVDAARLRDAAYVFTLLEPLAANTPEAHCEALFEQARRARYPTEAERAEAAARKKTAKAEAQAAAQLERQRAADEAVTAAFAAAGFTYKPPAPQAPPAPEPWTLERVHAQLAAGDKNFAGADLSSLDLNSLDLSGARLAGARLVGTWLQAANLTGAVLTNVVADGALFAGATLTDATLTGGRFPGALFTKANIAGVDFSRLDLTEARFEQAFAPGASFSAATLTKASFRAANLEQADFFKASAAYAVFDEALLTKANFFSAQAPGASFQRAALHNLRAAEADFRQASFISAEAPLSLWRRGRLDGADFTRATLTRANFSEAELSRACFNAALLENADFGEVVMTGARAIYAKLLRASFDRADLQDTDFSGANMYQAGFARARMSGAKLEGCLLTGTILA